MILGLTGGIASGKSTVSKLLKSYGCEIYDADLIAKEVYSSPLVQISLKESFGTRDRSEIKEIIFNDESKRKLLNSIIHPAVISYFEGIRFNHLLDRSKCVIVFDIPLLFESHLEYLCHKTLLIYADKEIIKERIQSRDGITLELAEKIINSQMSTEEKLKKCDYSIDNSDTLLALSEKVSNLYQKLLNECSN